MFAAKLISSSNTTFAIPRRNFANTTPLICTDTMSLVQLPLELSYQNNTSSGATSVYDSTFFFITDAFRIYKVLYNGDPTQTGAVNISGSDPTSEINTPFCTMQTIILSLCTNLILHRFKTFDHRLYACDSK